MFVKGLNEKVLALSVTVITKQPKASLKFHQCFCLNELFEVTHRFSSNAVTFNRDICSNSEILTLNPKQPNLIP